MSDRPGQSVMEHLEEFRWRLVKAGAALIIGVVVAFAFRLWIFDLVVEPYRLAVAQRNLVFFRPTEAFSIFMRLSLFGGLILASPVIFYQAWAFVAPALTRREKRMAVPIVAALVILFLVGVMVGYRTLEFALGFLIDFGGDELEPVIGGNEYLTFAIRFLLVFGLAFQFPVFVFAAAAMGVVGWRRLAAGRRWVLVVILIVSALATPGDPLTMVILATPLYLLYEATIWLVRLILRR